MLLCLLYSVAPPAYMTEILFVQLFKPLIYKMDLCVCTSIVREGVGDAKKNRAGYLVRNFTIKKMNPMCKKDYKLRR